MNIDHPKAPVAAAPRSRPVRETAPRLQLPLPAPPRAAQPLASPSDWTFELIERYHETIAKTVERFGQSPALTSLLRCARGNTLSPLETCAAGREVKGALPR